MTVKISPRPVVDKITSKVLMNEQKSMVELKKTSYKRREKQTPHSKVTTTLKIN